MPYFPPFPSVCHGGRLQAECRHELPRRRCAAARLCNVQIRRKIQKSGQFVENQPLLLVRQKGFEPPTFWFVAKHSIQLSYWRMCNLLTA